MVPRGLEFRVYSPPQVDRIWLWVYYNKIPIYPIFYLLKGDYRLRVGDCVVGVPRDEMEFPKLGVFVGARIIRITEFWCLYGSPRISGLLMYE